MLRSFSTSKHSILCPQAQLFYTVARIVWDPSHYGFLADFPWAVTNFLCTWGNENCNWRKTVVFI